MLDGSELLLCLEEGSCSAPRRAFQDKALLADDRVLKNLLATEERYMPSTSNFMFQKDILPYMRRIVATWMLEVCEEQNREDEVFPLAMNYLDRILSAIQVKRSQLQLVATVCMFIASKVRESSPIEAERLVQYTDYSITLDDLLEWERLILHVLKWDTSSILPNDFLQILLAQLPLSEECRSQVLRHSQTFIAMCATEYSFAVHPPSVIASSSISAALTGLMGHLWSEEVKLVQRLQALTSIDADCIKACQEQIEQALKNRITNAAEENTSNGASSGASSGQKTSADAVALTPTDVRDIQLCH